jgi:hypothetical protein
MTRVHIHDSHLGLFNTASGVQFDLHNPTVEMINVNDIIIGLSNVCRFGGQIDNFYSVAQHCILVAALAPPVYRRAALLHDASEAYVHDIIKPLKNLLGEHYAIYENAIMELVCQKFNVNQMHMEMLKPWDMAALEMEDAAFRKKDRGAINNWTDLWKSVGYEPNAWLPNDSRKRLRSWFEHNEIK